MFKLQYKLRSDSEIIRYTGLGRFLGPVASLLWTLIYTKLPAAESTLCLLNIVPAGQNIQKS